MRRIREEKSRRQKIREEKESEERRCRRAKNRKVAKHYVFPVICDSGGSKSRLAKAAGAEPSGQIRDEKLHAFVARSVFRSHDGLGPLLEVEMSETCTPLWREAHFEVKMCITARSEHLQKLWCRKSARRCGAKHISKSKCKNTPCSDHFLEVEMSKKCTPLWREAHFQVKSAKKWRVLSTFGRSDVVVRGTRKELCVLSQVSKTWRFCSSFNYNHHYTTLHYTTLRYATLRYTTLHYTHYTTLRYNHHYITLHYTTLHCTALHCTTLHYTTLITWHYTTLHYTTLDYTTFNYTTLHDTSYNYNNY